MSNNIEMNMLRERAKGIPRVTKADRDKFHEANKEAMQDFLEIGCADKSVHTIKQYRSALNIYFRWVHDYQKNRPIYEHDPRMWSRYMAWLNKYKLSSSALRLKRATISSLCEYLLTENRGYDNRYNSFINFTKNTKIASNRVYDKIPVTFDEMNDMVEQLVKDGDLLTATYLMISFYSGARRAEVVQIKVSDIMKDDHLTEGFNYTGYVRAKGEGGGNSVKLKIPTPAITMARAYLETRDFESQYLFANPHTGKMVKPSWCNLRCSSVLSPMLGRRINPHILRASSCTYLLEIGQDLRAASKHLNHAGIEVTTLYDLRSLDEGIGEVFKSLDDVNIEEIKNEE